MPKSIFHKGRKNQRRQPPPAMMVENSKVDLQGKTDSVSPLISGNNFQQMFEIFKNFLDNLERSKSSATGFSKLQIMLDDDDDDPEAIRASDIEILNDDLKELMSNMQILKNSYQEIGGSLICLQGRPKQSQRLLPETPSELTKIPRHANETKTKETSLKAAAKQTLDRFMNPATRNEMFTELFRRVEYLAGEMSEYDPVFLKNPPVMRKAQPKRKIGPEQCEQWREQINQLNKLVKLLLQQYNREVLELFRIQSSQAFINGNKFKSPNNPR